MRTILRLVLLVGLCFPMLARAQTVTLPTIRTGKALEVDQLNRFLEVVRKDRDSLGIKTQAVTYARDTVDCDLTRLALAAFTDAEIRSLLAKSPPDGDTGASAKTVIALDNRTRALLATSIEKMRQQDSRGEARTSSARALSDVFRKAPSGCKISSPPSELEVRNIIERYLEAETDVDTKARLDTLGRAAIANVIQTKLRERQWFPARTHDQAMAFWKQSSNSSLNVGAVNGSGDKGTTFTEITSRFLHPIRISINAVLAATKDSARSAAAPASPVAILASRLAPATADSRDSTSASTVTRFLNGGGLFNVAAAFPWLHLGTSSGAADFVGLLSSRVGATLPMLGATAQDTTMLYDVGTELFFKSTDRIDGIGFFVQSRIAVAGGSRRFMTLIGDANAKWTAYQTLSVGLTLDDKYLITVSRTLAGPHSLQTGWQIGTTLARSAASPTTSP